MKELLCDTISSLSTDSAIQLEVPVPFYEDMGFFQGDSLIHPEIDFYQVGFDGFLRPYQLWHDNLVTLFIIVCFLLIVFILKKVRFNLLSQIKDFFFPSKSGNKDEKLVRSTGKLFTMFVMLVLSMMGGLGVFMYTQRQQDLFLGQVSPYMLIGIYIAIWVMYFVLKYLFYSFVNWIFFDKNKRKVWRRGNYFLFTAELFLFFPVIITSVYFNLPSHISLWIIVSIGIIVKILLLHKTFLIFFPKIYGSLHLIVYFCTLEIMPLLAVFKVLIRVTDELIVKF